MWNLYIKNQKMPFSLFIKLDILVKNRLVSFCPTHQGYSHYPLSGFFFNITGFSGNPEYLSYEQNKQKQRKDFDNDGVADWQEVVKIAKSSGFEWGGDWNKPKQDTPHFQITFGYSVEQLLNKFKSNDFIPNTKYLNL